MRKNGIAAAIIGLLGAAVAAFTIYTVSGALKSIPVMARQPEGAAERAEFMMQAISDGDLELAGTVIYGMPSLGTAPEADGSVEGLLWQALIDSIEYDFPDPCYASDTGVTLDVVVKSLELASVTEHLKERSETMMNERVEKAENVNQIYDEKNNYREDFVMGVLRDAASDALREDARLQTQIIPLSLIFEDDEWWVLPNTELMNMLCGGTVG